MKNTFGNRLRELRKATGKSQRELGKVVGIDYTYLSRIENGKAPPPSPHVIRRLSENLKAKGNELFDLANKEPYQVTPMEKETVMFLRTLREKNVTIEDLIKQLKEKGAEEVK